MKFAYVLTSDGSDIYYEQLLVSLISLKHWNPDAEVSLVCDDVTATTFVGLRSRHNEYVDEIKIVEFPKDKTKHYRSRFLKTSLRELLIGDFLYLDSDTIICDRIEENVFTGDVMGVDDSHFLPQEHPGWSHFKKQIQKSGFSDKSIEHYVNGGVLWMKDCEKAHAFSAMWQKLWMECVKCGVDVDQPSLNEVNKRMNNVMVMLSGDFNCQLSVTMRYFNTAKIIHCFATTVSKKNVDKFAFFFLNPEFYIEIKKRELSSLDIEKIIDVKQAFDWEDSVLLCKNESIVYRRLIRTNLYGFVYCLFNSKRGRWLFDLLDWFVGITTKIFWPKK